MRFFARLVCICNGCFILAVILRFVENAHKNNGHFDGAIRINSLESTLVVLGYGAIIINFIYNLLMACFVLVKYKLPAPVWINWINFLFLLLQVYYFFYSNF
jgi:hypothetical protein